MKENLEARIDELELAIQTIRSLVDEVRSGNTDVLDILERIDQVARKAIYE